MSVVDVVEEGQEEEDEEEENPSPEGRGWREAPGEG